MAVSSNQELCGLRNPPNLLHKDSWEDFWGASTELPRSKDPRRILCGVFGADSINSLTVGIPNLVISEVYLHSAENKVEAHQGRFAGLPLAH